MTVPIIGVAGAARAGKDTFGTALAELCGYRIGKFSQTLKDVAKLMHNWDDRHIEGDLKEVADPLFGYSPREFMLKFGTDFGRNMLGKDIWIKINVRRVGIAGVIMVDTRFPNEAKWVLDNGGMIVLVEREGHLLSEKLASHESEAGIGYVDPTRLWRTGPCRDVDALRRRAVNFYHAYLRPNF